MYDEIHSGTFLGARLTLISLLSANGHSSFIYYSLVGPTMCQAVVRALTHTYFLI